MENSQSKLRQLDRLSLNDKISKKQPNIQSLKTSNDPKLMNKLPSKWISGVKINNWNTLINKCATGNKFNIELSDNCVQTLFGNLNNDSVGILPRLRYIAQHLQLEWSSNTNGEEWLICIRHPLIAFEINLYFDGEVISVFTLVDAGHRQLNTEMLECLRKKDYDRFQQHISGFIDLRSFPHLIVSAEQCLSSQVISPSTYWDIFEHPINQTQNRVVGIPARFYYFLDPTIYVKECLGKKRQLNDVIIDFGYYFTLTSKNSLPCAKLNPPVDVQNVNLSNSRLINNSTSKYISLGKHIVLKLASKDLLQYNEIALKDIDQLRIDIKLLKIALLWQSFYNEISKYLKPIDKLPPLCKLFRMTTVANNTLEIAVPLRDDQLPFCIRIGVSPLKITGFENELVFNLLDKVPSVITILNSFAKRIVIEEKPVVVVPVAPVKPLERSNSEVSLKAVFNSVIERFTKPKEEEEEVCEDNFTQVDESTLEAGEIPKQQPQKQQEKPKKPRRPYRSKKRLEMERQLMLNAAGIEDNIPKVEPIRIKISSIGKPKEPKKRGPKKRTTETKKKAETKNSQIPSQFSDILKSPSTPPPPPAAAQQTAVSLSNFKIPRKKAGEVSEEPIVAQTPPIRQQNISTVKSPLLQLPKAFSNTFEYYQGRS